MKRFFRASIYMCVILIPYKIHTTWKNNFQLAWMLVMLEQGCRKKIRSIWSMPKKSSFLTNYSLRLPYPNGLRWRRSKKNLSSLWHQIFPASGQGHPSGPGKIWANSEKVKKNSCKTVKIFWIVILCHLQNVKIPTAKSSSGSAQSD